jgi:membrane protein YdbS with pleckstrin-like domain
MKCPTCGAELASEAAFCHVCGARLGAEQPAPHAVSAAGAEPASRRGRLASIIEEVLWEGGYAPKAMTPQWLLAGVLTVVAVVAAVLLPEWWWAPLAVALLVWIYFGLSFAYKRLGLKYRLTNQRFIFEHGILRRVTDRVDLIDIHDLASEQGLIERYLGVGRITILADDRTTPRLVMDGIDDVQRVAGTIDKARRDEKLRRGLEAMGHAMEGQG